MDEKITVELTKRQIAILSEAMSILSDEVSTQGLFESVENPSFDEMWELHNLLDNLLYAEDY